MKNTLEEYAKDGGYEDDNECWHEDATDLLQIGILGFCGCGSGRDNLLYVLRGLAFIDEKRPEDTDAWIMWMKEHNRRTLEHFKSKEAEQFFYYWCDKEALTEHGSVIPGWLTQEGRQLLGLLQQWKAEKP